MAPSALRRFSDPGWLRRIAPERLTRFLQEWRGHLVERGLTWPEGPGSVLDCERLGGILFSPTTATPSAMVDALYYVHETCTHDDMDALIDMARDMGLPLEDAPEVTPAELAIEIWLQRPDLLERRHAEVLAHRKRSFNYYAGRNGKPRRFPELGDTTRQQVEAALDDWFAEHRRGRGSRVFVFREPSRAWIVVRHGKPMQREAAHTEDGTAAAAFFRPQQHDVLLYDEESDELGVYAKLVGERKLYLRTLGRILFGDEAYFPDANKFTLDPLTTHGQAALACDDIDGIERVTLVEYLRRWGGRHKEVEIRRADDIFAARAAHGQPLVLTGPLAAAVFQVCFAGVSKPRRVMLRPKASAQYERDGDSALVEQWLRARGFMRPAPLPESEDDEAPEVLEGTDRDPRDGDGRARVA